MAIQGLRGLESITVDGQRPKNWREKIIQLWPNGAAPLFALTNGLKSESVDDPEYNWFEKEFQEQRLALGADISGIDVAGDSDVIVLTGTGAYRNLKKGHVLMFEQTGELVLVTADPTANNDVNVTRGLGLTAGAALTAIDFDGNGVNPNLIVVGTAHPEADTTPTPVSWDPVKKYNYTQIFRDSLGSSRTAQKTRYRTGDLVSEMRRETLEQHSVAIERALIWGKPSEVLNGGNGHPRRTTGGLIHFLDAAGRTKNFSGSADMEDLEEEMYELFRYGSTEKMMFCGGRLLLGIQQVVRRNTAFNFEQGSKEYGMNVTRFTTPFGTLVFKTHPLFQIMRGGTTGAGNYIGWESSGVILDMEALRYRYIKDSDTKYLPKRQDNGLDGDLSEYLTECGLEIHQAKRHRVWRNLATGVADS